MASAGPDRHPEETRDRGGGTGRCRRAAALTERLLDRERAPANQLAAGVAERLGWEPTRAAMHERQRRPFVLGAEHQRGEDLAAEPARPYAVPGVAGAEVDARLRHGAEARQLVRGDVDRPAPARLDSRIGEGG